MRLIVVFSILMFLQAFNLPLKTMYSYDFWSHNRPDGNPSKCDCDYKGYKLLAYDDSTAVYTEQRGRLDPVYTKWIGKWMIEKDTVLRVRLAMEQPNQWQTKSRLTLYFAIGKLNRLTPIED